VNHNPDSFYKPIEREVRKFNPLQIPKGLQKELPFASKPKLLNTRKKKTIDTKRAVVMGTKNRLVRRNMSLFLSSHEWNFLSFVENKVSSILLLNNEY
tara:strand:+ start:2600 stop:2893 length:294 start_codon:yes stop_codon:yes gene_type:complete